MTEAPACSAKSTYSVGDSVGVGDVAPKALPIITRTLSPTLYVDFALQAGASVTVPDAAEERALYGVDTAFTVDGVEVPAQTMVIVPAGVEPVLSAAEASRVVLVGGQPLGQRHMWWNFVSSRKERIAQAVEDWEAQRMGHVAGETEFIPAPEYRPR